MTPDELQLLNYIQNADNVVAFTGAGISTESGIPDFRSVGGLYTSGPYSGHSPEEILSNKFFREKKNRPLFFQFYNERITHICDKNPNRAHHALKKLEDVGKLKAIVTQNIDNLHKKAGSQVVFEIHGNCTIFRCASACGYLCNHRAFSHLVEQNAVPICPNCGGIIRPCTVLFDEPLPDEEFNKSYHAIQSANLLIVIGSSLSVYPACDLVKDKKSSCSLVILNATKTSFDKHANLIIREPCGEVLENVMRSL